MALPDGNKFADQYLQGEITEKELRDKIAILPVFTRGQILGRVGLEEAEFYPSGRKVGSTSEDELMEQILIPPSI